MKPQTSKLLFQPRVARLRYLKGRYDISTCQVISFIPRSYPILSRMEK